MNGTRSIRFAGYTALLLLLLNGCVSNTAGSCSPSAASRGYFCYQGYNFGKDTVALYRQGVIHGCRTANGYFTKNYHESSSSEAYRRGWEKGRATCKLIVPESADPSIMRTQYQQSIDEQRYYQRGR